MKRFATALTMLCICAAPARAQDDLLRQCAATIPSGTPQGAAEQFEFMCAQVVNALSTVQPSVGIAFSGGNPVLGTGNTLGKRLGILPRVSATARVNVAFADMPAIFDEYSSQLTDGSPELAAMQALGVPVASLQGDVALGLFSGISVGPAVGGIGAIDLLGSVAVLPKITDIGLTEAITNIGVGARVGILGQGLFMPGVSVSAMYRRMDEISFGDFAAGDPAQFSTDLRTLSVRGVVSKGILALDLAVGAGYDRYTSDMVLDWRVTCETSECRNANGGSPMTLDGTLPGELTTAAWNVFGNVALDLLMLNVVGEIGYQKQMDPLSADDLRDAGIRDQPFMVDELSGGRLFGSIGVRISI